MERIRMDADYAVARVLELAAACEVMRAQLRDCTNALRAADDLLTVRDVTAYERLAVLRLIREAIAGAK